MKVSTVIVVQTLLIISFVFFRSPAHANETAPVSWRYKMTVYVDTPEGLRTGSAVRVVTRTPNRGRTSDERTDKFEGHGEAIIVDLGKRGVLFALLSSIYGDSNYLWALPYRAFAEKENTPKGVTLRLSKEQYPDFVWFSSLQDPKTIRDVFEKTGTVGFIKADHTAEFFGPGVKISKVTIEITDEQPVIGQVQKRLPWLTDQIKPWYPGTPFKVSPFPRVVDVTAMDFLR